MDASIEETGEEEAPRAEREGSDDDSDDSSVGEEDSNNTKSRQASASKTGKSSHGALRTRSRSVGRDARSVRATSSSQQPRTAVEFRERR